MHYLINAAALIRVNTIYDTYVKFSGKAVCERFRQMYLNTDTNVESKQYSPQKGVDKN